MSQGVPQLSLCENNSCSVFCNDVQVPGYWGGCYTGCKWHDYRVRCLYTNKDEQKYEPSHLVVLPQGAIEEVED